MTDKVKKSGFFGHWLIKNLMAAFIIAVVLVVGAMIFLNIVMRDYLCLQIELIIYFLVDTCFIQNEIINI